MGATAAGSEVRGLPGGGAEDTALRLEVSGLKE